jgi:hypothetical protein
VIAAKPRNGRARLMQLSSLLLVDKARSQVATPREAATISCGVGALMSTGRIRWLPAEPA